MLSPLAVSGSLLGALYYHSMPSPKLKVILRELMSGMAVTSRLQRREDPDSNTYNSQVSVEQKWMDCIIFFVITLF